MDSEKSPSDDHNSFNSDDDLLIDHDQSEDMAVAVAHMPQPFLPPPSSTSPIVQSSTTMNKRYRPAPAKTFQCRGYGECRMVFSRSEHLARHIRKHTGERPFTCHCGKQFSRLDNLRQHAQTVHSDKQDQNERMMHELTSLHATMTAATKGSAPRGKRGQAAATASAGSNNTLDGTLPAMSIKQEDGAHSMSMRPGTSTGYEGGDGEMYHSTGNWSSDIDRVNNHSFRDPGQSFRVPPASATAAAALSHQPHFQRPGQSFLASATFNFSLPDIADHSTGGSRPGTASRPTDRSLPPISTVVPASLPASLALPQPPLLQPPLFVPQQREQHGSSLTSSHVLPLPTPSASYGLHGRRPSTATRPGTAPASYYYGGGNSQSFRPGSGVSAMVAPRPELSLSLATGHGRRPVGLDHGTLYRSYNDNGGEEPTSPVGGPYDSPFSFHAPTSSTPSSATFPAAAPYASSSLANPRKRPYSGSDDGEYDDSRERDRGNVRPISSSGRRPATGNIYEYGSESRPQSRRLSVMELCNDTDTDPATRPIIPLSSASAAPFGSSRPTTSSGLVTSASQLALVDRSPSPEFSSSQSSVDADDRSFHRSSPSIFSGSPSSAGGADVPSYAARGGSRAALSGTGIHRASAQEVGGGTASAVPYAFGGVSNQYERYQQQQSQPPRSPVFSSAGVRWGLASPLQRGSQGTPGVGHGWANVSASPDPDGSVSPRSIGSPSGRESHRDDQVRVALGMRV